MKRNNVTQYQLLQSGIDNHTLDSSKGRKHHHAYLGEAVQDHWLYSERCCILQVAVTGILLAAAIVLEQNETGPHYQIWQCGPEIMCLDSRRIRQQSQTHGIFDFFNEQPHEVMVSPHVGHYSLFLKASSITLTSVYTNLLFFRFAFVIIYPSLVFRVFFLCKRVNAKTLWQAKESPPGQRQKIRRASEGSLDRSQNRQYIQWPDPQMRRC